MTASLFNGVRPPTTRRGQGERHCLIKLRERTDCPQLTDVPSDLRVNGARHAFLESIPPSKPDRPQRSDFPIIACTSMRGVGVKCRRCASSQRPFFLFIERTSTEAAEQTPRPRAGSAQAAGATNDHAQVAWRDADHRRELAASCSRSRWLPRHFYPCRWRCPGHQRLIREAWKRAPLLHYGSQVNPVRFRRALAPARWADDRASCRQTSIGFSCAPSGTTPVSR